MAFPGLRTSSGATTNRHSHILPKMTFTQPCAGSHTTWYTHAHLKLRRQDVTEQFWSISRLRSMNTSSRRVTVSQRKQRVSLTSRPWKISCTHVVMEGAPAAPPAESALPRRFFSSSSRISHAWFSR